MRLPRQPTLESQLAPRSKPASWDRWVRSLLPSDEWREDLIETTIKAAAVELADFGHSDDEVKGILKQLL